VRRVVLAAVLLFAPPPQAAHAQSPPRLYITGGALFASRDRGNAPTSVAELGPHRGVVAALTASAGARLSPWMAVDGEVQWQAGQSFTWKYSYLFDQNSLQVTDDRDVPVIGNIRFRAFPGRRPPPVRCRRACQETPGSGCCR
jgi:hypothetical protein